MIKESPPIEKQPKPQLSAKDYWEIGRQLLRVDPRLARAYFRQAGLSKEEIQQFFVESAVKEEKTDKKEAILPAEEKKELFEKMAAELEEKFRQTGKNEYQELAGVYRQAAQNLEKKEEQ